MAARFGGLAPAPMPSGAAQVGGGLRSADLGGLAIFDIHGTAQSLRRSPRSVRSAPLDLVKLCIQRAGSLIVHQGEAEVLIGPGEMVVYDTAEPYELCFHGDWRSTVMTIPREAMSLPWSVVTQAMTRRLGAGGGPASVLIHLIDEGIGEGAERTAEGGSASSVPTPSALTSHCGEAALRLLESALNAGADVGRGPSDGDDEQQRVLIRAWIIDHAREPGLCHDDVARAHFLSSRSLHRLFEAEDHSVTRLIRDARLTGARADLLRPHLRGRSVAAIADGWGFADQAHFTRAFRAAFGQTPAAYRRGAADDPAESVNEAGEHRQHGTRRD